MSLQRDLAILIGAAVAVFVVGTSISMMPKTPVAPKAKQVAVAPAPEPKAEPIVPVVVTPIAIPPQTAAVSPTDQASPALGQLRPTHAVEQTPQARPKAKGNHVKRKARVRIARKPDPCVGPLCALVTASK